VDARNRDSAHDSLCAQTRFAVPGGISVEALFRDPSRKALALIGISNSSAGGISFWRWIAAQAVRTHSVEAVAETGLGQAREWLLEHLERTEGLAAIYPAMMNAIFALLALGHSPDDPLTAREIQEFSRFEIEEGDTIRVQPCVSPVWDTAIAMVPSKRLACHPIIRLD